MIQAPRFYLANVGVVNVLARRGAMERGSKLYGKFAKELRELVDQVKARATATEPARGPRPVPLAQHRGELAGLLTVGYPKMRVAESTVSVGKAGGVAQARIPR